MTRDDMMRLARKAGFTEGDFASFTDLIVHFGTLVAAHEREACARVCDEFESDADPDAGAVLATAIRARGQE